MSDDKLNKRSGETVIKSVSVSVHFQKLLDEYNISPTEAFRRGVAVTLYDLGIGMYQSEKNEERSKYMHEFLQKLEKEEKLKQEFEKIKLFEDIKKHIGALKKITEEIEQ